MATQAELTGATDDEIAAARDALVTYVQALWPRLSVRAGELADLVLGPAADALAAVDHRAEAAAASLDPETALAAGGYDEDVLAAALAGRGVTRLAATVASGDAALTFSDDVERTVPVGYRLATADGVYYATSGSTRLLPTTGTAVLATDVVLVADGAGGYAAVVAVAAEEDGADANRPAGTVLTADTALSNQTAAYAATDLAGGRDEETDAELLARLPAATAPRTTGSALGTQAVIQDAVPGLEVSVVGFGHAAMRRGRSVLSSQAPGRADAWVRTADPLGRERVTVTAVLEVVGPPGQWRFTLGTDDAPGKVYCEKVLQEGGTLTAVGMAPDSTTWGYDLTDADPVPDVRAAADAMFSRYATATVRFTDSATSTSGMTANVTTRDYDAVVRYVPGVDTAQAAVDAADVRAAGGDCLVRAACPVRVAVIAAATGPSGVDLEAEEVEAAVAAAINAQGITSTIHASVVGAAAIALLPAGTTLQLSTWTGTVYATDGTATAISGSQGLSVTTDYSRGLDPDTVAFYCDAESVTGSVTTT